MSENGERQRVVKAQQGRRARLTPVDGTDTSPESPVEREERPTASGTRSANEDRSPGERPTASGARGANDDRLLRERPPHW